VELVHSVAKASWPEKKVKISYSAHDDRDPARALTADEIAHTPSLQLRHQRSHADLLGMSRDDSGPSSRVSGIRDHEEESVRSIDQTAWAIDADRDCEGPPDASPTSARHLRRNMAAIPTQ